MRNGFFRAASVVPTVGVADCHANVESIVRLVETAYAKGADMIVTPEMSLTGYTCGDLFHNTTLIAGAYRALEDIVSKSAALETIIIVGTPVVVSGTMYNCGVVVSKGKILAIIPKTYLPNYNEFYEKRWWASGHGVRTTIDICGQKDVPFGTDVLVESSGVKIGVEICEDLWTPCPPSSLASMGGAQIIANLSASNDLIGKYAYLRSLISQQSARCICGYVYASAGYGESTSDLVFDGKALIYENGVCLAESERWEHSPHLVIADIDVEAITRDRMHIGSFHDSSIYSDAYRNFRVVKADTVNRWDNHLLRDINPTPFVPQDSEHIADRAREIVNIQTSGLSRRLDAAFAKTLVVGISGGLDSTLALLVAHNTFTSTGRDVRNIIGVTMPGFGTTGRTYNNALRLMQQLGVTIREIPIRDAVTQHFKDIGHNPEVHDVTYENSQARERTQILMDIANQENGLVLGTGDLSELALGWATYNGDQMSMYGVNAGVPKTLVKYLVKYFAEINSSIRDTLFDIIDTPISPELIPADTSGNIKQKTEDLVGPYELHDFFLYYTLRYGFSPERILLLAQNAFKGKYERHVIEKWLKTFLKRFFSQQFKRSCMPDGPKVGSVCLSPRGDWRMPSDASSAMWLKQI